jgi:hypothetical protein
LEKIELYKDYKFPLNNLPISTKVKYHLFKY